MNLWSKGSFEVKDQDKTDQAEEIELTEEDHEILDRAWDNLSDEDRDRRGPSVGLRPRQP